MPTTPIRRSASPVAAVMEHLLPRDRLLLNLLEAHRVLTTGQVATLLFPSLRRCQDRLRRLYQLGLLERWRHRDHYGGSQPWRWTLGPVGAQLQAAANGQRLPSPQVVRDRITALATSPELNHRLGVNQFFTDLVAHTRTRPGTGLLLRWWPEQRAASLLRHKVVPDGHGLWHAEATTTAWFLEWDSGAEDLPRLIAKIAGYEKAARGGGPAWPVLFYLHSRVREDNLHRLLAGAAGRCPVATAARDRGTAGPAGAVWRLLGGTGRVPLHRVGGHVDTPAAANWTDDYQTAS